MPDEHRLLPTNVLLTLLVLAVAAAVVVGLTAEPGPGGFSLAAAAVGLVVAVAVLFLAATFFLLRPVGAGTGAIVLLAGAAVSLLVAWTARPGAGTYDVAGALLALTVAVASLYVLAFLILVRRSPVGTGTAEPLDGARPAAQAPDTGFTHIPGEHEGQHVLTLEGIGTKYATRLNNHGIITLPQLLDADPETVAAAVDAMPALVEEWQGMARLVQVKGIGPQAAEMLALAGVRTIQGLADADPPELTARIDAIEERRRVRVLGTDVQEGHVRRWVEAARGHVHGALEPETV